MRKRIKNFKTTRLTLEVPKSVRDQLERLVNGTKAGSMTEVICRALGAYEFFYEESSKGGRLVIQRDGSEREVVILG